MLCLYESDISYIFMKNQLSIRILLRCFIMVNGTKHQNSGGVGYNSNFENNVWKDMNLFRPWVVE